MDRTTTLEILDDWNRWESELDLGTKRDRLDELVPLLDERLILAVTGVRRCGKSTLLRQLSDVVAKRYGPHRTLFVNFEDPRWLPGIGPGLVEQVVATYRERHNSSGPAFLFLDEIQAVPDWERWARAAHDLSADLKVVVSGSSASLIGGALGTLLTGRHLSFELFPFSLIERLRHGGVAVTEADYLGLRRQQTVIRGALAQHLEHGGFPEVMGRPVSIARLVLQQYFEDIIARDVVMRRGIRDVRALRTLAQYMLTNVGNELSTTSVAKTLAISVDTVREYVGAIEESYMVTTIAYSSPSLKVVARRNVKSYAVDCGLRNVVAHRFSRDSGRLAENQVLLHLRSQGTRPRYWRNGHEVDFVVDGTSVVDSRMAPVIINVSYTDELHDRERVGLEIAMSKLKIERGLIVTDNSYRTAEVVTGGRVAEVPLWYFLLRPQGMLMSELFGN